MIPTPSFAFCQACRKVVDIIWHEEVICHRCGTHRRDEGKYCHQCDGNDFIRQLIPRCYICKKKNWEAMAVNNKKYGTYISL